MLRAMMRLVVGPLNYSSWSQRPYLALVASGLDFKLHEIQLFVDPAWRDKVLAFSGAGRVPILVDGPSSIHESLAICERLAELALPGGVHLWPEDAPLRARARAISAEMAAGFHALRNELPVNLRGRSSAVTPSAAAEADIARVNDIWDASLSSADGPFLFGDFSIADCMYYPVLTRFRTYGVPCSERVAAWESALHEHPAVIALRERADASIAIPRYDTYLETGNWDHLEPA